MVSFKMFAGTDVGLRDNNEDNFTVCPDLALDEWIVPAVQQQAIPLGQRGCIMVVADGMGGQNAGEVASQFAIETVQEMFSPEKLPVNVLEKPDSAKKYLKKAIVEADIRIKEHSDKDYGTNGMGSTIVMAWFLETKVYVAWLGDSRAYSYIPGQGIRRISKDHSYVQDLIDAGKAMTEEEAMNHPNSNIITRSLGDTSQKAKPDVMEYSLTNGEVILLCSDGLCGVCLDEEIGNIIEENISDLQTCKERLTTAALAAGGSDNITVALLQVILDDTTGASDGVRNCGKGRRVQLFRLLTPANILATLFAIFIISSLIFVGYSLTKFPVEDNKNKPELRISFKIIGSKKVALGSTVNYEVTIEGGDSLGYVLRYNPDFIVECNKAKRTLRLSKNSDIIGKTIVVTAVCQNDTTKYSSDTLIVKTMRPVSMEELAKKGVGHVIIKSVTDPVNVGNNVNVGNSEDDITPSNTVESSATTLIDSVKSQLNTITN